MRHAAVHVWKSVVVNTPRTLRQILPRLMDICVAVIAGSGEEARITASRCLGELVRKMSHQVRRYPRTCAHLFPHPRVPIRAWLPYPLQALWDMPMCAWYGCPNLLCHSGNFPACFPLHRNAIQTNLGNL